MRVWVMPMSHYPGSHEYNVLVDGEVYDKFVSKKKLRRDDMRDIAAGYKEGLTNGP